MSLPASHSVQPSPIDSRRPIKVMACGPDGPVTPDSHSRTSGVTTRRAKPTGTDPEDDRKADSTLPMGSTSKTYDPQNDYTMWQRKDSDQYWKRATSSGYQWKPMAGNSSDASAVTHRLKSIYESEGDAMKGSRSDAGYWR